MLQSVQVTVIKTEFQKHSRVRCFYNILKGTVQIGKVHAGAVLAEGEQPQFYDEIYFDLDSEDEERVQAVTKKQQKQKHRIPPNDELLYGPQQDNWDQAWVDAQRRGYTDVNKNLLGQPVQPQSETLPNSDAILNCSACMTTLYLDFQRHESYKTQYRAMFVMNCTISKEEVLKYQDALDQQKRRRPKK